MSAPEKYIGCRNIADLSLHAVEATAHTNQSPAACRYFQALYRHGFAQATVLAQALTLLVKASGYRLCGPKYY